MGHNRVVSGHPKSTGIPRVDGLSMGPPDLGRHSKKTNISNPRLLYSAEVHFLHGVVYLRLRVFKLRRGLLQIFHLYFFIFFIFTPFKNHLNPTSVLEVLFFNPFHSLLHVHFEYGNYSYSLFLFRVISYNRSPR